MEAIDLACFRAHGYQVLRSLLDRATIEELRSFLERETVPCLRSIERMLGVRGVAAILAYTREISADERRLAELDADLRNALSGHFPLETRLSRVLWAVPRAAAVQALLASWFSGRPVFMHMPPTARFVLPGNVYAGVPAHQDMSYNAHLKDFIVLWVPLVKIGRQCGGVRVHHGSGALEEKTPVGGRRFWLPEIPDLGFEKVHFEMEPGDALLLNPRVIHESMPNLSHRIRTSVDFRFFSGPNGSTKHYLDLATWTVVAPSA